METELKVRTYTKRELIEELEALHCDDDTPVLFSYNYGDYWKSTVAEGIQEIEEKDIHWSDYHRMYKVTDEEYRDQREHPTNQSVIILH